MISVIAPNSNNLLEANMEFSKHCRLLFGEPLENISPKNQIHPVINYLFTQAYKNAICDGRRIETILSSLQGILHERLLIKERLMDGRSIKNLRLSPGALLWIIRHFLGLLPSPLIPETINGELHFWWKLSEKCKRCLKHYFSRGRYDQKLQRRVAFELANLPLQNYLLLDEFMLLLRKFVVGSSNENVNKCAALALVKYFCSAVFVRPYRPGFVTKNDKQHYALFLYLILKWPDLNKYNNCNIYIDVPKISKQTQTTQEEKNRISFSEKECQTDLLQSAIMEDKCCTFEADFENNSKNETNPIQINRTLQCCCTYGTHYKTNSEKLASILPEESDNSATYYSSPLYGWNLESLLKKKVGTSTPLGKNYSESKGFMWDDFIDCNNYEAEYLLTSQESEDREECEGNNSEIIDRISKIGWTYTSPKSQSIKDEQQKPDYYQLCYDKEVLDEEEKEVCEEEENLETPVDISRSKKSLLNLNRIKSKLDFFKLFNAKSKAKKTCSDEQVSSNVKYVKMGSASSIF